jgi:lipoate-protein ligase A
MNVWRLVECRPAGGEWNMAVDTALIASVAAGGVCCLRFYAWSEPTVSLGYFQEIAARQSHPASTNCPLVRRPTGGGAIVHDREITYSFVAPVGHRLAVQAPAMYQLFHRELVAALADWDVAAIVGDGPAAPAAEEPFLCFQRRAAGDVLVSGWKIAGSAQRRRRGAVLQHGSVLLSRSPAAPELPGLVELSGRRIETGDLIQAWRDRLSGQCQICWRPQPLDEREVKQAEQLVEETYTQRDWTHRR